MPQNPTVIVGHLNDKELTESINKLVEHVDQSTRKMVNSFNSSIDEMKKKLAELGSEKIELGGVSTKTTRSSRSKIVSEEAAQVKQAAIAYDQLATSVQKATQPSSAQESFYAFIQHYRQAASQLAQEIKQMPSQSLDRQMEEYQRFQREISQVQQRIQELKVQLNELYKNPNSTRMEKTQIMNEIEQYKAMIHDLTAEQIRSTQRIANADQQALAQKQALYDKTVGMIKELTTEEKRVATTTLETSDASRKAAESEENRNNRLNYSIEQTIKEEKERKIALLETGLAAQKTAQNIIEMAHSQAQDGTRNPIQGVKELHDAIQKMRTAYYAMSEEGRQTDIGKQLQEDIKRAITARKVIEEYNRSLLGVQRSRIQGTEDYNWDSYQALSEKLKRLTAQYHELNNEQRESTRGKGLAYNIQQVGRAIEQVQSKMNRPIDLKSALGLKEETLDDIRYKMQMLSRYRDGLNLKDKNSTVEIDQINSKLAELRKRQNEVMGSNKELEKSNNALTRSFEYMKNRLAFYFTVGAMTQFVKQIYEIRSQYELLERSIGILVDSMQTGTEMFAQLNAMALKSPFTTMELGAAAKQLVAYDIAAKDVVDTTKRLADMAAAVGIPIERLTYALGQIKAYGYLNARDARMFSNAGIPLVKELADRYTELEGRLVSMSDVYDRIKKKSISFEDVMDVVNKITDEGGRFYNFQEKAADTLKVKLANLTLAYNNMMNQIGKSHQGLLQAPLTMLKAIYENWRKIDSAIKALVWTFTVFKGVQLLALGVTGQLGKRLGWELLLGKRLTAVFAQMGAMLFKLAINPFTWITAAIVAWRYLYNEQKQLEKQSEELNKTIRENTKENYESISKFFKDYKEDIISIGNAGIVDQQKMWEKVKEEIEKVTKNSQGYLKILEEIDDIGQRIQEGATLLIQFKDVQKEAQRLAGMNLFDVGGGFADKSLASNIASYQKKLDNVVKLYGSIEKAQKNWYDLALRGENVNNHPYARYAVELQEVQNELDKFVKKFDKAKIDNIISDYLSKAENLQNIREFTQIIRDGFLSTEEGQKITVQGQVILNKYIDDWIAKQGVAHGLLTKEQAQIEKNRTSWEIFFDQLNEGDKKRLNFLLAKAKENGGAISDEVKEIWDKAANSMKESSQSAYELIRQQISDLRATPDIVIRVVYQEEKENLDEQQESFKKRFLTPKNWAAMGVDEYEKQTEALNRKYGRFIRKANEDNVEWEKRLGETYRNNEETINKLNQQLSHRASMAEEDIKQKEHELALAKEENETLNEIKNVEGFDYSKDKKNKKTQKKEEDLIAQALQKEIQLINEMRNNYEKLRKSGVETTEAIELASQGYEDTILRINNTLQKFGIDKFNASNFAGKDVKSLLRNLEMQHNTLLSSGKVKLQSLQSLDVEIKKLTIDAKTYDMKKISDGLNNELGKLKEDYELAVELDANPELGDMFADMMGIDVSALPHTFADVFGQASKIAKSKLKELGVEISDFDILSTIIKGDADNRWMGLDMESEPIKELLKQQKTYRDMFKKVLVDTEKDLDNYVKKYGGYADKIAEIEANRLEQLKRLNNAYYTEEMRKRPEYIAKLNAIEKGAERETSQVKFDDFKNSRYYTMMFENLDYVSTKAIRDMRQRLIELKDDMNDLTPEQLKTIIQQYEKLEQKLVKRSPFRTLGKDLKAYLKVAGKRKTVENEFRQAQYEYDAQKKVLAELKKKQEQNKANQTLTEQERTALDEEIAAQEEVLHTLEQQVNVAEKKADEYNLIRKLALSEVSAVIDMVGANIQSLGQLRDFIQEMGIDLGDAMNGFIDGLTKANEGVQGVMQSAKNGDIVGTLLGVGKMVAGMADGFASLFGGGSAKTRKLNRQIAQSEEAVRKLNMAYKELERTVDSAMGAEELRARRSEIANKRAQLAELERQMALERQKRSKDRDDDKIKQYEESIQDLRNEIDDLIGEVSSTILGSSVKDAAESFVDTWVNAWREGSDTMDAIGEKFDDMIDTMIAKSLASSLVSKRIKKIWEAVDEATNEESVGGAEITLDELQKIKSIIGDKTIAEQINEDLTKLYNALGIAYGSGSGADKNLSALQQGIQGVTEETAGAIEAYMNGMSQQVYLQSDLLTEIRDTLNGFEIDIQTATMSQILLQLQQSYAIQIAIQNTLNGALNPSGRAFMVELTA